MGEREGRERKIPSGRGRDSVVEFSMHEAWGLMLSAQEKKKNHTWGEKLTVSPLKLE
jgi:hypothetical protein